MSPPPKPRSIGLSPKVPVQALAAIVAFIAAYFGLDLSPEASAGIAALLGAVAGYIAPPGRVDRG